MIIGKVKDAAGKILLMSLLIFVCSNFVVFGQEKQREKSQRGALERVITGNAPAQEETPQPTPETKKPTRERKVENSGKPTPEDAPSDSSGDYTPEEIYPSRRNYGTAPPMNVPTTDYTEETERTIKDFNLEQERQNAAAQQQLDEFNRQQNADNERRQKEQQQELEQIRQQQKDRQKVLDEQYNQGQLKIKEEQEAAQKIADQQDKWFWLIPLFEILQAIGLGLIAFKIKAANKSAAIMIVAAIVGLLAFIFYSVVDNGSLQNLGFFRDLSFIGLITGVMSGYAFGISKLSTYIIFSLVPKPPAKKMLLVFGIGGSLIALYLILNAMTGHGAIGALFGVGVILIGGVIALVKDTKGDTDDLHGSARFAEKKEFKEFENPVETGAFILAPAHPDRLHGKLALPRSLSLMHGLILGGSGTGKSRGFFMPNCAEVENTSLVVTDPKSELWKYTSGFHDKALRYAPTEPEASQCFNWIPLCTDARMSELCARALMTAGSTGNTDQFWIDSETAFLSAIFAHTATTK
jgi:hypothetical protein